MILSLLLLLDFIFLSVGHEWFIMQEEEIILLLHTVINRDGRANVLHQNG